MIYVTSDTHFCHDSASLLKSRGFATVEAMNEAMIKNWNKVVKSTDTVYHLGDVIISDNKKDYELIKRLHGKIILIKGNHDTPARIKMLFAELGSRIKGGSYVVEFKHNKTPFYASHFPTITAKFDAKPFAQHIIGIHGHTHCKTHWIDKNNPFMYDCGVDSHNFTPVSLDQVMANIKRKWEKMTAE